MRRVRSPWYGAAIAAVVAASAMAAFAQGGQGGQGGQPRGGLLDMLKPKVLTGDDIGFRLDGTDPRTGRPAGTWVVKVNGEWVEAVTLPGIRPAQ